MAKVLQKKCPTCGAPLPLKKGVSDVTCTYCGNAIHIEWNKSAPAQVDPRTLYVAPTSSAAPLIIGIAVTMLIAAGSAVAIFVAGPAKQVQEQVQQAMAAVPRIGGEAEVTQFPATCAMNQKLTIKGQKFKGKGPLIVGAINCKIEIVDSNLESDVIVEAKNLTEVTVVRSQLNGSKAAVQMDMNAKLFVKEKSKLVGGESAVVSGVNGEVRLDDSEVEGKESAIRGAVNFHLVAAGSKLRGKEAALVGDSNLNVELRDSELIGERVALAAEGNLELQMRGGTIRATEAAVRADSYNPHLKLSHGAKLVAKETALETEGNLELSMDGASIEGGEVGVSSGVNAKLDLRGKSSIKGKKAAVKLTTNSVVKLRDSKLEASELGLCAGINGELEARNSTISGSPAISYRRKPRKFEIDDKSTVSGKPDFSSKSCGN